MRAVLERDFLSMAIRGRSFILRALVAAVTAIVAFLVISDDQAAFRDRPDEAATLVFAAAGVALLSLLALLTPPSVVGSILDERQRETLPLVLAAPVGPTAFAAAKILSRSMAVLTWALAAIVPLAVVTLLGGVALSQVAELAMLACGVVLELAAWGLWISSVTRRLATGTVLAYLFPVTRWVLTALVAASVVAPEGLLARLAPNDSVRTAWWAAAATTPLPGVWRMLSPVGYDKALSVSFQGPARWQVRMGLAASFSNPPVALPPPPGLHGYPAHLYLGFALVSALLAILAAGRRLATESEPRTGFLARFIDRGRAARAPPDEGNPVAWKEARLLNTGASRPLFYSVLALMAAGEVLFLVSCGTVFASEEDLVGMGLFIAGAHSSLIGLVAIVACAAGMAHERAAGSLDLLRASPLTPREILRGKVGGLLRGLGFLGLFPLAHLGMMLVAGLLDPATAVVAVLLDGIYILFFTMAGLLCGISALRTGSAVTRGAIVYGIFVVGIPLAAAVAAGGLGWKGLGRGLMAGWPPFSSFWIMDAAMGAFRPGGSPLHSWGTRDLGEIHIAAFAWTILVAAFTLIAWDNSPRILARRFAREREDG